MIYYGQITHQEEFEGTKECVAMAASYVDQIIIVEAGDLSEEQKSILRAYNNVLVVTREWKDDFPKQRNHYLDEARRIASENGDKDPWILVSDSDECFNEGLMRDIQTIVKSMGKLGYDLIGINCHESFTPTEWLDDLDLLKESPGGYRESHFWKNLLFRLYPDLLYLGVGETKTVHETLSRTKWTSVNLPVEKYWYTHRKSALKIWLRAAQNFFIGGGGTNVGERNPLWKPFKDLCSKHGIDTSGQFKEALRSQLPEEVERQLIDFLWTAPTNYGVEMREAAKYYFILHPEKRTPGIDEKLSNPPPLPVIEQARALVTNAYFEVLGRHPDENGLETYTFLIMSGKIKKEDLYMILRGSPEYQQKFIAEGP